jgi:enoyl-CoA hydratase/carnithine racemase
MHELVMHCHFVVAEEEVRFGFPEVSLPVVPGMEGCHWLFRRAAPAHWPRIAHALLSGEAVKAKQAVGWCVDVAEPLPQALATAWALAAGTRTDVPRRPLATGALTGVPTSVPTLAPADDPLVEAGRAAIADCITRACAATAAEALDLQARIAAEFLASAPCRAGRVGQEASRILEV